MDCLFRNLKSLLNKSPAGYLEARDITGACPIYSNTHSYQQVKPKYPFHLPQTKGAAYLRVCTVNSCLQSCRKNLMFLQFY